MTVQPPAPVAVAPAGPSAATLAARRRAAAARVRRARIAAQHRRAARIAAAKEAERRKLAAGRADSLAARENAGVATAESGSNALPFLLAGLVVAAVLIGLALTPARAVPSNRAARVLEDKREEVAVLGAMGLLAVGLFFLFLTVVAR